MHYQDLRDFIRQLEQTGQLRRVEYPVDPRLEMTEICDRTLRAGGPALLFENPVGFDMPVLGNLFGTPLRVAAGMGADSVDELRDIGRLLAFLRQPEPPGGLKQAWEQLPVFRKVLDMAPKVVKKAASKKAATKKTAAKKTTTKKATAKKKVAKKTTASKSDDA